MQATIANLGLRRSIVAAAAYGAGDTSKIIATGHMYQIRNHVKMYPWRRNRNNAYSHLDNTRTPYTDKHNLNEFRFNKFKLKTWQRVICKDKDNRFNRYKWIDAYKSDPMEAKETAQSKLKRLSQSLKDRGEARERLAYNPPGDVQEKILSIVRSALVSESPSLVPEINVVGLNSQTDEELLEIGLDTSKGFKFRLISKCINSFCHDLPSSHLNDVSTIRDLVEYYSTPVRGVNPYEHLISNKDLPPNLTIIPEPHRFDVENDEFFKGYNALPGTICQVPGLRATKKYKILNQDEFQWPDI